MADMKENNMNDGVPSLDETAAEAVRLSVGPRPGAGPEKPRKDRRRIIIGAAAVAVAVLVAGGVCAHRRTRAIRRRWRATHANRPWRTRPKP